VAFFYGQNEVGVQKWRKMANTSVDSNKELPKKRMAAGALFFNHHEEALIVKPTYRDYRLIPGGVIEHNESPYEACVREVREEIGTTPSIKSLLCIDFRSAHDGNSESMQLVFDGGMLSDGMISQIHLDSREIETARWCSVKLAKQALAPKPAEQIEWAMVGLRDDRIVYMENKREIGVLKENGRSAWRST
jgi:8-oxo-dGTP diphosphatase